MSDPQQPASSGPPLEITCSRHFLSWLGEAGISLAFTTYQTNRLFLLGLKPDNALSTFERHFERPMGFYATSERLYMNSLWRLWELGNALPEGETYNGYDRLYVPRRAHTTGHLDVHDIALDGRGEIVFVNTLYSCLARVSERYSFMPIWKPPFISKLAPEDRCHLNGLAMADGEPAYVTTVSRSDVATGWRDRRERGGCVIDVEDDEILLDSLSMPHSPRVYHDRLWVLNSGSGELGYVDHKGGRFEPVAFCPGYLRGLAFHGDFAIVGLSKQRKERTFSGLALDDRLRDRDADARCGLWVIDLKSGNVAHWVQLDGVVIELYDVAVIPGVRRPMALGFKTDEIQRLITIEAEPKAIFEPLSVPDPASHAAHSGDVPRSPSAAAAGIGGQVPQFVRARAGTAAPSAQAPHPVSEEVQAEYRRANELAKAGKFAEAIACYEKVLRQDPSHVNARINLGTSRHRLGDVEAALSCYREALRVDARSVRAHCNLAAVLRERGDLDAAISHYEAVRQIEPGKAGLLHELGTALCGAGRLGEAKSCLEQVLRANPRSATAHNSLGAALLIEQKAAEAQPLFERAVEIQPSLGAAHVNLGNIFEGYGEVAKARAAYACALSIRNNPLLALRRELICPPVFGSVEELDAYRKRAESAIEMFAGRDLGVTLSELQSTRAEAPFEWAYHGRDNLPLKRKYTALFEGCFEIEPPRRRPQAEGPWHVGFVVTPTHEGIFLRCMAGIVDGLDRQRFRVSLACSRMSFDLVRRSLRNRELRLIDLPLRFDHAVARLRAAELDLIYFWEVGTDTTNYFLPFCRLASVQCTGWGWPETSAAPALDVHLSSAALAPPGAERFFSERLVRMPHLPAYCVRPPVEAKPEPVERFGLPAGGNLYLCAQNLRKAHPDFDAVLGAILRFDPRGVVAFVHDKSPTFGELLRRRWERTLGEVLDRLVILPRQVPNDYIRLVASAHVVLDTPHFSGANTAYDALAVGVPTVTLPGEMPRSRYTAELYRSAGIEDCIATSVEDYVNIAVGLGTDATRRNELRERILGAAAAVFENRAAVSQLESSFTETLASASQAGIV